MGFKSLGFGDVGDVGDDGDGGDITAISSIISCYIITRNLILNYLLSHICNNYKEKYGKTLIYCLNTAEQCEHHRTIVTSRVI